MKKILLVLLVAVLVNTLQAQVFQKQYIFNKYVINPAAAGEYTFSPVYLGFCQQFSGHVSAPKTYFLSYNTKIKNVGLGIDLSQDNSQTLSTVLSRMSYSYSFKLNNNNRLSFGLSALVRQFKRNYSEGVVVDEDDPLLTILHENTIAIDSDFGVLLKNTDYYLGASVSNLLKTKLYYGQATLEPTSLSRSVLLHGGYHFSVGSKMLLTPSFFVNRFDENLLRYDINVTLFYDEFLKLGLQYQNSKTIGAHFGLQYQNMFFAYIFDLNNSALKKPSHELAIGYFRPIGESKKKRLNRLEFEKEVRKKRDSDGDGINDGNDACPNSWGLEENNGCPNITEELKIALSEIQSKIYFVDEEITDKSIIAMMKLGDFMLVNKGVKIRVSGTLKQVDILSEYLLDRWSIAPDRIQVKEDVDVFNMKLFAD